MNWGFLPLQEQDMTERQVTHSAPTPQSDAAAFFADIAVGKTEECVHIAFARQLERELAEAKKHANALGTAIACSAVKAGIYNGDAPVNGATLVQLCVDMANGFSNASTNGSYADQQDRTDNDRRCAQYGCGEEDQLQWRWRDPKTLPTTFNIHEAEAALLDAFTRQGGAHVWSGDGSSCAAQIVEAVWKRGDVMREYAVPAFEALRLLVAEFDDCNANLCENNPGMDVKMPDTDAIALARAALAKNPAREEASAEYNALDGESHAQSLPRAIPADRKMDATSPTDSDLCDVAALIEREVVKRVLREVEETIEASGFSVPFKAGLSSGVEEVQFRLETLWGEHDAIGRLTPKTVHEGRKAP
jgi:hypothetical protein